MALTPKQRRFVNEYLKDLNATGAARRAGYSARTANTTGPRILHKPAVAAAIVEAMTRRRTRLHLDQDYVLLGLMEIVERTLGRAPAAECEEAGQGALFPAQPGDRFDPRAAAKALELLGKHLGLFVSRHEHRHHGEIDLELTPELRELVDGIIAKSR